MKVRFRFITVALLAMLLCAACTQEEQAENSAPAAPPPPEPFTIAMLPDTQHYSEDHPKYFYDQTRWLSEQIGSQNIVFVTHVGDVVEHGDAVEGEWQVATEAMGLLRGRVPYGIAIGNHDYDLKGLGKAATFLERFGPEQFTGEEWYIAASENELNSAQMFNAAGRRFLILHLEANAPNAALDWAEGVLADFPGVPAIVSTHIYLDDRTGKRATQADYRTDIGNSGEQIWQKLIRKHPQIFMVLCGHWWTAGGEAMQISNNDAGQPVIEMLADYQNRADGGEGYMRLLHFDLAAGKIHVETYSPSLDRREVDENSEFDLDLTMDRLGEEPAPPAPVEEKVEGAVSE